MEEFFIKVGMLNELLTLPLEVHQDAVNLSKNAKNAELNRELLGTEYENLVGAKNVH